MSDETTTHFNSLIKDYMLAIDKWMDEEKPYLDPHLKLLDVTRAIDLNRTYISRLFNNGFGKSFQEYVRDRRIAYACALLLDDVHAPIGDVAMRCGFSSHSSFHRTFLAVMDGVTPGQYRRQHLPAK